MKLLITALSLTVVMQATSAYKGSVSFSSQEIATHARKTRQLLEVSKNCLETYQRRHIDFYRSNCKTVNGKRVCLSKFFGDRRYAKKRGKFRSDGKPLQYLGDALRNSGFSTSYMSSMESTSCVGMALTCLKRGFDQTGQSAQWKKVRRFVNQNAVGGTSLQHALQKIGWKLFYWNPTPLDQIDQLTREWDAQEKNWQSKGWHNYRMKRVMRSNRYWFNTIDNKSAMVGFEDGTPYILRNVPFWVGTAHTGYHVFPGTYSKVIEAHSTRHITSVDNMEFSTFAPMANGGGPRWTATEKYRSGMIALPPGY